VKCAHKNVTITETIAGYTSHTYERGVWSHNNEPGSYNQRLQVECHDCDLQRTYWRGSKNIPKWLKKRIDGMLEQ